MENWKKVLYVRLKKYLYRKVRAALLFYQNLTGKLKECVFELIYITHVLQIIKFMENKLQYCSMLMI